MSSPTTAGEWAETCPHLFDRWGAHFHGALCLACANAYARAVYQTVVRELADHHKEAHNLCAFNNRMDAHPLVEQAREVPHA